MKAVIFFVVALFSPCKGADFLVRTFYGSEIAESCTAAEWDSIWHTPTRRTLVRSRDLCKLPAACVQACAGFKKKDCVSYRSDCPCTRQLRSDQRQLSTDCDTEIEIAQGLHLAAYNGLSTTCQAHVDTRTFECYQVKEDVEFGSDKIQRFKLWNTDDNLVLDRNLVDQSSFCENDFNFRIEAVVGGSVTKVKFGLYGPNGYNYEHMDFSAPFKMMANSEVDIEGHKYMPGDYSLMATPDDDDSRAVAIQFTIQECAAIVDDMVATPLFQPPTATTTTTTTCSALNHRSECSSVSDCFGMYPNLGADDCSTVGDGVCYCGSSVCGCMLTE